MLRFEVPAKPISELDRTEIRALAKQFGGYRQTATRVVMALLPAIKRLEIFRDDGCTDLYEWAAKFLAMPRDPVDRALALYQRIGGFGCLWQLLAEGIVGPSKLERAAPHVTEANAAWLAEQIRSLPKAQLEEVLRQLGPKRAAPARHPSPVAVPIPSPSLLPAGSPGIASCADPQPRAGGQQLGGDGQADWPEGPPREDPGDKTDAQQVARLRLSLEVDALGEKRIRDLQRLYQQSHGKAIGLGDLFVRLAHQAVALGVVPGVEDPAHDTEATGRLDEQRAPDAALPDDDRPDRPRPGEPQRPPEEPQQPPVAALALGSRRFRPRVLEVVVSVVETGWKFVRTAAGWLPVPDGAFDGFLSPCSVVPLANVRIAALAAADKATGRHLPAAVDRYIRVRSGGYCEARDCHRPLAEIHHRKRHAFDPSHHPDDLVALCDLHHGSAHFGLIVNEDEAPGSWQILQEGQSPASSPVDLKVQQFRAAG